MSLRTILISAVVAAAATLSGAARSEEASPGALAAARELAQLITGTGFQSAMIEPGWAPVEAAIRRAKPDATAEQVAKLKATFTAFLNEEMAPAMAEAPPLYAKYFNEDELRAILAFYRTPAGAKALAVMPQLSQDSMKIVMGRFTQSMPRFQERFQRALVENGMGDLK